MSSLLDEFQFRHKTMVNVQMVLSNKDRRSKEYMPKSNSKYNI